MSDETVAGLERIALKSALEKDGYDLDRLDRELNKSGIRTINPKVFQYAKLHLREELELRIVEAEIGADFDPQRDFWKTWNDSGGDSATNLAVALIIKDEVDPQSETLNVFAGNIRYLWQNQARIVILSKSPDKVPTELKRSIMPEFSKEYEEPSE